MLHLAKNLCGYCTKPIYVKELWRIDIAKFCSNSCKKLSKPQRIEKKCITCGDMFLVHQCYAENTNCCNKRCKDFSQRNTVAKFLALIDKKSDNECWEWLGNKDDDNYGYTSFNYVGMRSHRVMYELWYGEFDKELKVCHTCDNPSCCNPHHLFLGTAKANSQDAKRKGRVSAGETHMSRTCPEKLRRGDLHPSRLHPELWARGEQHGNAKLTTELVKRIRILAGRGVSQRMLARIFHIGRRCIYQVVNRHTWRHVK